MQELPKTVRAIDGMAPDEGLQALGRWIIDTCLLHGASPVTAFICAALIARGLQAAWSGEPMRRIDW